MIYKKRQSKSEGCTNYMEGMQMIPSLICLSFLKKLKFIHVVETFLNLNVVVAVELTRVRSSKFP